MRFGYTHVPDWAPLAWLARGRYASTTVEVFHGTRVEIRDEWFCEATWAGDFELGGFDQTDIVAGSGARLRDGKVVFVASGSTVDRLHSLQTEDGVCVSNSLPCLLATVEATVDPCYEGYLEDFESIVHGIEKYRRVLSTSAGSVYLTYFDNLLWDGQTLCRQAKPAENHNFASFARYRDFLLKCIQLISENMAAKQRNHPYKKIVSTCSSGYDSPAVTALVKQAGCKEALALSFDRARSGDDDSGEAIAASLGIPCIVLEQNGWRRSNALSEVPFMAASPGTRDLHFKEAEDYLSNSVLFSGFRGGTGMWDKTSRDLGPTLVRRDDSGVGLSEYRLWVGFLHCPVPFFGARQAKDINAISNSCEMKPWDIGGDYNRPIPRRILEEAGIPREVFGVHKKAAGVFLHSVEDFLTPLSKNDFHGWLREQRGHGLKRGRIHPFLVGIVNNLISRHSYIRCKWVNNLPIHIPGLWRLETALGNLERKYVRNYVRRYTFPWAIEHAKSRYSRPF